jgi:ABC-type multidrug transport system, permease component
MKAFTTHLGIQLRLDMRDKGTLLTFYIIPLIFYAVMGTVFSSIMPEAKEALAASMTIFAVTMGAVLGLPPAMVSMRESGTLRAYRVCGVPGWSVLLAGASSALIHLAAVSLVIALSAPLLFGAGVPANLPAYIATLLLLIIVSIVIGLLVGVCAKTHPAAAILSQAVFLPSLLLSGIMFPAEMLPEPLLWLGKGFPASHAMQAFREWAYGGLPLPVAAFAVMAAIGAACFVVTLIRFKRVSAGD